MEIWDLYTQDRGKTGETVCRGAKIPDGRFHLQVHVCIFNGKGEMLIQLRQKDKQWYPDLWDYSVGGSAVAGDNSVAAAVRETQEELGLTISLQGKAPALTRWYDQTIDDYYILHQELQLSELQLQAEEVQATCWASYEEVMALLTEKRFCPNERGMIRLLFELAEKEAH